MILWFGVRHLYDIPLFVTRLFNNGITRITRSFLKLVKELFFFAFRRNNLFEDIVSIQSFSAPHTMFISFFYKREKMNNINHFLFRPAFIEWIMIVHPFSPRYIPLLPDLFALFNN